LLGLRGCYQTTDYQYNVDAELAYIKLMSGERRIGRFYILKTTGPQVLVSFPYNI